MDYSACTVGRDNWPTCDIHELMDVMRKHRFRHTPEAMVLLPHQMQALRDEFERRDACVYGASRPHSPPLEVRPLRFMGVPIYEAKTKSERATLAMELREQGKRVVVVNDT